MPGRGVGEEEVEDDDETRVNRTCTHVLVFGQGGFWARVIRLGSQPPSRSITRASIALILVKQFSWGRGGGGV